MSGKLIKKEGKRNWRSFHVWKTRSDWYKAVPHWYNSFIFHFSFFDGKARLKQHSSGKILRRSTKKDDFSRVNLDWVYHGKIRAKKRHSRGKFSAKNTSWSRRSFVRIKMATVLTHLSFKKKISMVNYLYCFISNLQEYQNNVCIKENLRNIFF